MLRTGVSRLLPALGVQQQSVLGAWHVSGTFVPNGALEATGDAQKQRRAPGAPTCGVLGQQLRCA
jgi:hypothetical protein